LALEEVVVQPLQTAHLVATPYLVPLRLLVVVVAVAVLQVNFLVRHLHLMG
jgi:hypothetical protein